MKECKNCVNCEKVEFIDGTNKLYCHEGDFEVKDVKMAEKCECYADKENGENETLNDLFKGIARI